MYSGVRLIGEASPNVRIRKISSVHSEKARLY